MKPTEQTNASLENCNRPQASSSATLLDASLYREWIAMRCQQTDAIGGGIPFAWKSLSEESKEKWRKLADQHAATMASNTEVRRGAGPKPQENV